MYYDEQTKKMVWNYALPPDMEDAGGFDIIDYPGGLYAVAISIDGDENNKGDGEQVYAEMKKWIKDSGVFETDERPGHYTMFNIVTPDAAYDVLGYRQIGYICAGKDKMR